MLADEGGGVAAGSFGNVRNVDHDFVHRDGSEEGAAFSVDEKEAAVAAGAGNAVGVSGGDDGDAGFAVEPVASVVANGGAGGKGFDDAYFRVPAEGGFDAETLERGVRVGKDAELEEADADGVPAVVGGETGEAGAVVDVEKEVVGCGSWSEAAEGGFEAIALGGGEGGVVGRVGEMGVNAVDSEERRFGEGGGEFFRLFVPDSEAAHAGVDFDVDRENAAGFREFLVSFRFFGKGNGGDDVEFPEKRIFVGDGGTEEEDWRCGVDFADLRGFGDVGDGENFGSGGADRGNGLAGAEAVAVGFDDGNVADAGREILADAADVFGEIGEVDLGPAAVRERRIHDERWRSALHFLYSGVS